jgi:hypothetical protein
MAGSKSAGAAVLWRVAPLVKARGLLKTMFSKYLLVTNVTTAFTLSGTGDLINQRYEKFSNMRTQHNYTRTRNQCIQVNLFICIVCHSFIDNFEFLLKLFEGRKASNLELS